QSVWISTRRPGEAWAALDGDTTVRPCQRQAGGPGRWPACRYDALNAGTAGWISIRGSRYRYGGADILVASCRIRTQDVGSRSHPSARHDEPDTGETSRRRGPWSVAPRSPTGWPSNGTPCA